VPEPTLTLLPVPLAPEISLHLCGEPVGLFDLSGGEFRSDEPPPFWAFVWAGGQALARYVLDHPEVVAGKRVHDLATGSGVAAIAAAKAGAAEVSVSDVDPAAVAAAMRNAAANGVEIVPGPPAIASGPPAIASGPQAADVLLAGDVFYSPTVAGQMTALLRQARREAADVLVGDPGRGYFPERLFQQLTAYVVPVRAALEETDELATGVWRMR
jgi:predicted nicotinamide N-methyase